MEFNDSFGPNDIVNNNNLNDNVKMNNVKEDFVDQFQDKNNINNEYQNNESQSQIYNQLTIKERLNYNIQNLFRIIKKHFFENKMKFFYELKYKSDYKYSKLIEAEIMFLEMQNKLNIFNNINKRIKYKYLKESFMKLKNYVEIKKYKNEQDKIKSLELKEKINKANNLLKSKKDEYKLLNDNINKLNDKEKKIDLEIEELNKTCNSLNNKYTNLLQKSKLIKDSIKLKSSNNSLTLDKSIDPKIAELQNLLRNKEMEKEKSMKCFENFYKKMNDMIQIYENSYEDLKSKLNLNEVKSNVNI